MSEKKHTIKIDHFIFEIQEAYRYMTEYQENVLVLLPGVGFQKQNGFIIESHCEVTYKRKNKIHNASATEYYLASSGDMTFITGHVEMVDPLFSSYNLPKSIDEEELFDLLPEDVFDYSFKELLEQKQKEQRGEKLAISQNEFDTDSLHFINNRFIVINENGGASGEWTTNRIPDIFVRAYPITEQKAKQKFHLKIIDEQELFDGDNELH